MSLVVNRENIPTVADVVTRCVQRGHKISFPRGFEFSEAAKGPWIPVTLDGVRTGFDAVLATVASMADEEPAVAARLSKVGSHLLAFGARGPQSVRAVAAVMGAVSELSGGSAWVEDELVPARDVPRLLAGMLAAENELPAKIAALPSRTKAEQKAAFDNLMANRPRAASPRRWSHIVMWICVYAGVALIGWFVAMG